MIEADGGDSQHPVVTVKFSGLYWYKHTQPQPCYKTPTHCAAQATACLLAPITPQSALVIYQMVGGAAPPRPPVG